MGKTKKFYLERIQEKCRDLRSARDQLTEMDQFIRGHGTIGTDEDRERVMECYQRYESLTMQVKGIKRELGDIVEECVRESGADLNLSWTAEYEPELGGRDATHA